MYFKTCLEDFDRRRFESVKYLRQIWMEAVLLSSGFGFR